MSKTYPFPGGHYTETAPRLEWDVVDFAFVQAALFNRAQAGALWGRMFAARHRETGALMRGVKMRREKVLRGAYPVHDWLVDFVRPNIGAIEYGSIKRRGLRIAHRTLRQMGG